MTDYDKDWAYEVLDATQLKHVTLAYLQAAASPATAPSATTIDPTGGDGRS